MKIILYQMLQLFAFMLIGWVANKLRIMDGTSNAKISRLIINITIPALIISSSIEADSNNISQVMILLGVCILSYIVIPLLSFWIAKLLHWENTFQLMLNYSNLGFMGIPLISSIYGSEAVIYVSVYMMVCNISIFSTGVHILDKDKHKGFNVKKLFNIGIISALIGFFLFLFDIPVYQPVTDILGSIGGITSPLAMITIGSILAETHLIEVFSDIRLYVLSALRLFIIPILIFIILRILKIDSQIIAVSTILWGLPVAGNVSMLCMENNGNAELVTKGISITTILSLISLPVIMKVIEFF